METLTNVGALLDEVMGNEDARVFVKSGAAAEQVIAALRFAALKRSELKG